MPRLRIVPQGAQVGAVALKVRSRVPNSRVYIEDVFDLVLWHPEEKKLELVLFHLKPVRGQAAQWPSPSTLVRQHLAERLKVRWPFEKTSFNDGQSWTGRDERIIDNPGRKFVSSALAGNSKKVWKKCRI